MTRSIIQSYFQIFWPTHQTRLNILWHKFIYLCILLIYCHFNVNQSCYRAVITTCRSLLVVLFNLQREIVKIHRAIVYSHSQFQVCNPQQFKLNTGKISLHTADLILLQVLQSAYPLVSGLCTILMGYSYAHLFTCYGIHWHIYITVDNLLYEFIFISPISTDVCDNDNMAVHPNSIYSLHITHSHSKLKWPRYLLGSFYNM